MVVYSHHLQVQQFSLSTQVTILPPGGQRAWLFPHQKKKKTEVASVLFSSELTLRQTHFYYKQMRALEWFDDVHQSPSTHFKSSINITTVFFNVLFVIGYSQSSETWRYHFDRCDDTSLCPERAARLIKSGIKTNNTQNIIIFFSYLSQIKSNPSG